MGRKRSPHGLGEGCTIACAAAVRSVFPFSLLGEEKLRLARRDRRNDEEQAPSSTRVERTLSLA